MSSELIPFHALPIYKESTDFVLTDEEKSVIVDGEFRKALSKQGNAISKSADILDDDSLPLYSATQSTRPATLYLSEYNPHS